MNHSYNDVSLHIFVSPLQRQIVELFHHDYFVNTLNIKIKTFVCYLYSADQNNSGIHRFVKSNVFINIKTIIN